jgi:hypothetical protein
MVSFGVWERYSCDSMTAMTMRRTKNVVNVQATIPDVGMTIESNEVVLSKRRQNKE